ncbi:hypothetical protein H6F43_12840 [Leptolyngbya sp. FACHB-36]|uniref:lipid-A-disaccharide synthase-related protein n=1 Tax=Leptolyngbya sp. FACHB-36 TaxID=2692808 RepID=UPI00168196B3|nr:lipid-A-disaccharide synthase-related protein [Leptolyngbya sp. FACHB-36]MBD2021066.1 hypothetical protein [Leptolyngbya sp. FACHB-36]
MRLLCLSNGHGEDVIALRILQALRQQPNPPNIEALPIVGVGHAYTQAGISIAGAVKRMPSGGFINTDRSQLARDLQGGLLQLTLEQIRTVREWSTGEQSNQSKSISQPSKSESSFILAVGDIVPLVFAWLSGLPYAFIGTARSEYYLRDESGWLPRQSWWDDRLERWTGCVYLPWERWLMRHPRCKAVFPRDRITALSLKRYGIPAFDLGNPMMDGLDRGNGEWRDVEVKPSTANPTLTLLLLPGSRPPEAYDNWETLLQAANGILAQMQGSLRLLVAIAPGLDAAVFHQQLLAYRWQQTETEAYAIGVGDRRATLTLMRPNQFAESLHVADLAIAMAGTATEQFVGLGKPAILIPGKGPQFTPTFAEAQTRLLGASVELVTEPVQAFSAIRSLLANPDRLHLIAENGRRRLGEPGAAKRIAQCLLERMGAG